ncbi:Na+/H+ antiporter subunit E [Priestia megaterium]|uniref:Na+/H+ antiporter subunit E n=1 Tax=Priestia TaxID=2800373 RepID=UPI001C0BC750|nr:MULTISPECIES: Na+/H+ antiporter subunit E [Priestia]MBU3572042.1 Na+/H+ antiporter subunit E [Priestia aryabhattai]MED3930713.1 Na+/H+ antiporter subunit E [Priestia megaterium]WDL85038.1 Na+/H+ antiporter subunit E [Priestia aryabhattai]
MSFQLLLNVTIAFTWMFLRGIWTLPSFIIGFFWGAVLLFVFRRFFHRRFYLHKVYAIIKLLFIFIRELFKANIAVTKDVLRPKLNIQPAIFAMPTRLESEWEITILSLLITLTPGTLVMDVSDDNSTIYIHAINTDDIDDIITDIQQTFEKAIMEVSR